MWDYRAKFVDAHDGDTVHMVLDLGFGVMTGVDLRLLGVFAPELADKGGQEARSHLLNWFNGRVGEWPFQVRTTRLRGDTAEKMTLGRYLATVELSDGSESLNVVMMAFLAQHPEWGGGIGAPKAKKP